MLMLGVLGSAVLSGECLVVPVGGLKIDIKSTMEVANELSPFLQSHGKFCVGY